MSNFVMTLFKLLVLVHHAYKHDIAQDKIILDLVPKVYITTEKLILN